MPEVIDFRVRLPAELRPPADSPDDYWSRYDQVLGVSATRDKSFGQLTAEMTEHSVSAAVVHAEYEHGEHADALNEAVAQIVAEHPGRFWGYGTISMANLKIPQALRQVERVASLGLRGLNLQPSFFGLAIDDRRLYPVYAKAHELGLHVAVHTGVNYTVTFPIRNDHPLQLDQVACDFPGLVLIACHAGWPWVPEMVAVMRKHPSVYAEFGGLAPRYVCEQNTGWEVMFRFMNSLLARQVLYGTDWPVFPMGRALAEWRASRLRPEVLEALLGGNARALLAGEGGAAPGDGG
jgi:predicted TIM-barrel fold metal-dependent hydrolase